MTGPKAASKPLYATLTDQLPSFLNHALVKCKRLPSLPTVALRVLEVSRRPASTLQDYANALEHDPALTARLIAIANSVHHKRANQPVRTCFDATQRLGLDLTLATALSFSLFEQMQTEEERFRLWERALTAAVAAKFIAQELCPRVAGNVFTSSLLQDIGILALRQAYPDESHEIYADANTTHGQIINQEKRSFGCDHALVGAWLLAKWGAPDDIVSTVYHSHDGLITDNMAALCVRISGPIADAWLSAEPSDALAKLLRQIQALKPRPFSAMDALLAHLEQTMPKLANILGLGLPDNVDSHTLMEEAQQHLFEHTLTLSTRLDAQHKARKSLLSDYEGLKRRSRIDPLTQLATRAWLDEQLHERFTFCQHNNRTMSVIFIDLDHFKTLNDRYGHSVGDQVLSQFGKVLASLARSGDLAGRYGGEEFLIILPDEIAATAERLATRIVERLKLQPMAFVNNEPIHITVSIGVACISDGGFKDERELIDAADKSMYFSKRAGRAGISVYGQPSTSGGGTTLGTK